MNLAAAMEIHALARPAHPAVIEGDRVLSHADFARAVRQGAAALASRGVRPGDTVGLCLADSTHHLVMIYATARLGAVMLPMDLRWTEGEKSRVAAHFGTVLVVIEADAAPLPGLDCVAAPDLAQAETTTPDMAAGGAETPLLLSLSSGTTGRPKGPRISHEQMLRRFWTHWINMGLNATDRYLSATPLYFGGGRTFAMSVLFAGGTVILFPPPFRARNLCEELARVKATSTFLVPTQLRQLLDLDDAALAPARDLRLLISSGAPLEPGERRDLTRRVCAQFVEYYASTEGGGISLATPETRRIQPDSVGRPVFAVEAEAVGDDHAPLPPGKVGRLRYRGPGVAQGYHRDPEASAEAFHDGWFYPGDLAEIDDSGLIILRGRVKDIINRGGVNIHPGEIETVLRAHPAVADAAVVAWPSVRLGEEVAAFVVAQSGIAADDLTTWCSDRLAPYKVPAGIFMLDQLPRNSAGKVLKTQLSQRLAPR